jgi:hypothetical protein
MPISTNIGSDREKPTRLERFYLLIDSDRTLRTIWEEAKINLKLAAGISFLLKLQAALPPFEYAT